MRREEKTMQDRKRSWQGLQKAEKKKGEKNEVGEVSKNRERKRVDNAMVAYMHALSI